MKQLGVGVVGLGVGEAHATAFAALPSCELRWVFDVNPARAQRVAGTIGQGRAARSFAEILHDERVDIVSIASYDDAHCEQTVAALDAGKHVFVEKPLGRTIGELRAVKDAWKRADRRLASNLVLRAAPAYRWLKDAIAVGTFGEVYAFDGDYLYGRIEKITRGWRGRVDQYSVMTGGGIHLIDLMLWAAGQRPDRVSVAGNRISTAGTMFRYDDFQAATFQFASTLIGRVTANFGCVHRHQHVVRVFGTKGTFVCDDQGPRVFASREQPAASLDLAALPVSKGDLIPAFVDAVVAGAACDRDMQHECDVISVCVAADRAARTGEPVDVEYV
jgi:predicted dehydrogenase